MLLLSHRSPLQFVRRAETFLVHPAPGGIASALRPLRRPDDQSAERVICVAAAMGDDRPALARGCSLPTDIHLLTLEESVHALHYDVVCNSILWPVLNRVSELATQPTFDESFAAAWGAYRDVNRRFAEYAAGLALDGETIVVNDYQLGLVPKMLREMRPDARLVFFLHTPFPGRDWFDVLPDLAVRSLTESWSSVPVGLHTRRWEAAFREGVVDREGTRSPARTFVAPLGPDPVDLQAFAATESVAAAHRDLNRLLQADRSLILRVERLDPTKNTVRGIAAYDLLLGREPARRRQVQMAICLVPSRSSVPAYRAYGAAIRDAVSSVNERWGDGSWRPVHLLERDDYAQSIAALERYDVLFNNSISDGMNLVVKEGAIVNRRNGSICLSRAAGAFEEMTPFCFEVHPYDVAQGASALSEALSMTASRRADVAQQLRTVAGRTTSATWLAALQREARPASG